MDVRLCPFSNTSVTSGFCMTCSYLVKRYTLDPDNPFCGFTPYSLDYPFPVSIIDCNF